MSRSSALGGEAPCTDDEAQRLKARVRSPAGPFQSAHNLHHERPEEVGQDLQAFLANARGPRPAPCPIININPSSFELDGCNAIAP